MVFARRALKEKLIQQAKEIDARALQRRTRATSTAKHSIAYAEARRKVADYVLGLSDFAKSPKDRKLLTKLLLSPYFHVAQKFATKNSLNQLDKRKLQRLGSILIHLADASRGNLKNDFVSNGAATCLGNLMALDAVSNHPRLVRKRKLAARSNAEMDLRTALQVESLERKKLMLSASKAWLDRGAKEELLWVLMREENFKDFSSEEVQACKAAISAGEFDLLKGILKKHKLTK